MPTIIDVAKKAGVSVGTVSRVLSNNETVKEPLKRRVLSAVDALGYKPNLAARALRTNRVDVIGLVVPDITNPFFSQLAKSIETEAALRGHMVMLANSHDDAETERKQISALIDRIPRGVIVIAAAETGPLGQETDVPIISVDRRFEGFPLAATDHAGGSAKIADHLFGLGHRKITYIAGPQSTEVGRARRNGFVQRIQALSSPPDPVSLTMIEGQFHYENGEQIAREVLAQDPPTAIAAASDQLAIGVLRAARDLKLDVPGDLSVAGFDDIDLASLVVPRLTTIRQPTEGLAKAAIQYLFGERAAAEDAALEGKLIIRGSTQAI